MRTQTIYIDRSMLASGNKRFINYIVDSLVHYFLLFMIGATAGLLSGVFEVHGMMLWLNEMNSLTEAVFNISILVMYYFFMESLTYRTLGKYLTGTRVVMKDGSKPEAGSIALRTLCRLIPFEAFSFIGSTPRGWHDSLSGTYLVDIKKYEAEVYRLTALDEIGQEQDN